MQNKENDEFLQRVKRQYLPENEDEVMGDIFTLYQNNNTHYEEVQCASLKNKNIYDDWKNFLYNLPESDVVVPQPLDKYWRWNMYKRYVPKERTNFRKTMSAGPGFDKHGILPITGEALRFYRQGPVVEKQCVKKSKYF